jgi:REP element-mobilizing transposase RayT
MPKEKKRRRSSIRLDGYDYSQEGAYFVTICTKGKMQFFDDKKLSTIVEDCWKDIPSHFPTFEIDEFVVMPNHFHGIIWISNDQRRGVQLNAPTGSFSNIHTPVQKDARDRFSQISPRKGSLGVVIRTFKGEATRRIRASGKQEFGWQRGYYDRIIRNRDELDSIRKYISENPIKWTLDEYHPSRLLK